MKFEFLIVLIVLMGCSSDPKMIELSHLNEKEERFVFTYLVNNGDTIKEGTWSKYYQSGGINGYITFCQGERCRLSRQYYEDGTLSLSMQHLNGKRSGSYNTFYKNGKLKYSGAFDNDIPVGIWKSYAEDGVLMNESDGSQLDQSSIESMEQFIAMYQTN